MPLLQRRGGDTSGRCCRRGDLVKFDPSAGLFDVKPGSNGCIAIPGKPDGVCAQAAATRFEGGGGGR